MTKSYVAYTTAAIAGLIVLTVVSWIWIDEAAAHAVRRYHDHMVTGIFKTITHLASAVIWYPLAYAGIVFAYLRFRTDRISYDRWVTEARAWLFMLLAMLSSSFIKTLLKIAFGRDRPAAYFEDGVIDVMPFNTALVDAGFPSGHSQSIAAAMFSLAIIYPPLRLECLAAAVLVMMSRIFVEAHFVSDVIAGGTIGIVAVLIWRWWFERDGRSLNLAVDNQLTAKITAAGARN